MLRVWSVVARRFEFGFVLAIFMANAGGTWDNAKKYVEDGNFGGRGPNVHKATVVGDTVGDPFKDTSGLHFHTYQADVYGFHRDGRFDCGSHDIVNNINCKNDITPKVENDFWGYIINSYLLSIAIELAGQEQSIGYAYGVRHTVKNANTTCVLLTI